MKLLPIFFGGGVFIQFDLNLLFRAELILKLSCVARTWAGGDINLTLFLSQVGLGRIFFNTSRSKTEAVWKCSDNPDPSLTPPGHFSTLLSSIFPIATLLNVLTTLKEVVNPGLSFFSRLSFRGFSQEDYPQQRRPTQHDDFRGALAQRNGMFRPSGKSIYSMSKL